MERQGMGMELFSIEATEIGRIYWFFGNNISASDRLVVLFSVIYSLRKAKTFSMR